MAVMPHILLDEKMTAPYALLPGDPARLDRIAAHLDQVEELAYNREFLSLRGFYKGVRVMALSTGLGGPSTAVAVEELAKLGVSVLSPISLQSLHSAICHPSSPSESYGLPGSAPESPHLSHSQTPAGTDSYMGNSC